MRAEIYDHLSLGYRYSVTTSKALPQRPEGTPAASELRMGQIMASSDGRHVSVIAERSGKGEGTILSFAPALFVANLCRLPSISLPVSNSRDPWIMRLGFRRL